MKIDFDGRTWQLDPDDLRNKQAEAIHAHTGLPMSKFLLALGDEDQAAHLRCWEAMYWLMLQQNGETATAIGDVDFAYLRFAVAFLDAGNEQLGDKKEETGPDPTRPPAASARSQAPPSRKQSSGRGAGAAAPDG